MDPDATLARLIDAAIAGKVSEYSHHAYMLGEWLSNGGFPPADPRDKAYQEGVHVGQESAG